MYHLPFSFGPNYSVSLLLIGSRLAATNGSRRGEIGGCEGDELVNVNGRKAYRQDVFLRFSRSLQTISWLDIDAYVLLPRFNKYFV